MKNVIFAFVALASVSAHAAPGKIQCIGRPTPQHAIVVDVDSAAQSIVLFNNTSDGLKYALTSSAVDDSAIDLKGIDQAMTTGVLGQIALSATKDASGDYSGLLTWTQTSPFVRPQFPFSVNVTCKVL